MNAETFLARRNSRTQTYGARPLDPAQWYCLSADPGYATTAAGQTALIVAANLVGRMTGRVAIDIPPGIAVVAPLPWAGEGLQQTILASLERAAPARLGGEYLVRGPQRTDMLISFGRSATNDALVVYGSGWNAYVGRSASPLAQSDNTGLCGPALAAILCGAQLMDPELVVRQGNIICNAYDWTMQAAPDLAPSLLPMADVGDVWTIGTGSVGTAALYFLSLFTRSFDATLIDMDKVKIENLDRSPIFVADDCGSYKVEATASYLRAVGARSVRSEIASLRQSSLWRAREEGSSDVLIATANEDDVRTDIELGLPPIQLYGTTGRNWQASLFCHVPFRDACSLCAFPPKPPQPPMACGTGPVVLPASGVQVDAALPFLSYAAGLMTTAEVLKLTLPDYQPPRGIVQLSVRGDELLASGALDYRPGCLCRTGRDGAAHRAMIAGTRYAHLSP